MESLIQLFIIFIFAQTPFVADKLNLIPVKISFLEALAPKDTKSSERFQKEYDFAIQTGKDLTKAKLSKCGYALVESQTLFNASDERCEESERIWGMADCRAEKEQPLLTCRQRRGKIINVWYNGFFARGIRI